MFCITLTRNPVAEKQHPTVIENQDGLVIRSAVISVIDRFTVFAGGEIYNDDGYGNGNEVSKELQERVKTAILTLLEAYNK